MLQGRLPWLRPEELNVEQRRIYESIVGGPRSAESKATLTDEAGRLQGPFNVMLVEPNVGDAVQRLGATLRFEAHLDDRAREIAILEVARASLSAYEWYVHEKESRMLGFSDAEIAGLLAGSDIPTLSQREVIVRQVTRHLLDDGDLPTAIYDRALGELGLPVLVDLVFLVGYYEMLARSLRVWRTPLPHGAALPVFSAASEDETPT